MKFLVLAALLALFALVIWRHFRVRKQPRFLAPTGFMRIHGRPVPDAGIRDVLTTMCERSGQHQPPKDLAAEARARLDRGDPPREVAESLRTQLAARGRPTFWLDHLLDTS